MEEIFLMPGQSKREAYASMYKPIELYNMLEELFIAYHKTISGEKYIIPGYLAKADYFAIYLNDEQP